MSALMYLKDDTLIPYTSAYLTLTPPLMIMHNGEVPMPHVLTALCLYRTASVSILMCVKEDLVIPHHTNSHDLISQNLCGAHMLTVLYATTGRPR